MKIICKHQLDDQLTTLFKDKILVVTCDPNFCLRVSLLLMRTRTIWFEFIFILFVIFSTFTSENENHNDMPYSGIVFEKNRITSNDLFERQWCINYYGTHHLYWLRGNTFVIRNSQCSKIIIGVLAFGVWRLALKRTKSHLLFTVHSICLYFRKVASVTPIPYPFFFFALNC